MFHIRKFVVKFFAQKHPRKFEKHFDAYVWMDDVHVLEVSFVRSVEEMEKEVCYVLGRLRTCCSGDVNGNQGDVFV